MNLTADSQDPLETLRSQGFLCVELSVAVQKSVHGRSTSFNAANTRNLVQTQTSATTSLCDPNYSSCVLVASDVDCAGGRGNVPAHVKVSVKVIGKNIYGLDKDRNGIGCE